MSTNPDIPRLARALPKLAEAAPTPWLPPLVAFFVAFAWRVSLILLAPVPYSFDGYQRWAGRDHFLVQDWLPATQGLIWLTARLGGDLFVGRVVMAAVAATAACLGSMLVMRIARERHPPAAATWAGWAFVIAACFGPWCSWGTVFYQESTFLVVLFAGLLLAGTRWPWLGDVVIGLVGLVRYEGWPCIVLYIAWRSHLLPLVWAWLGALRRGHLPGRDEDASLRPIVLAVRRAWRPLAIACWGMIAWMVIRAVYGHGYQASPVSFADWEGLGQRFTLAAWLHDARTLAWRFSSSTGVWWIALGVLVAWRERASALVQLITLLFLAQVAITVVWLAGLEVSTSRMTVIPVVLAAVLGAVAVPDLVAMRLVLATTERRFRLRLSTTDPAPALGTRFRILPLSLLVPIGLAVMLGSGLEDARHRMRAEAYRVRYETPAVTAMEECPGCTWWVLPRRGLGTRARHDGCEVIQGTSNMLAGSQFYCAPWVKPEDAAELYANCSGTIRWNSGTRSYLIERHLNGSLPPMPDWVPDPALRTDDEQQPD